MKSRPVNLNLFTIRFPITAIVSILHRLSGLFLVLLIPALLYLFEYSLSSRQQFNEIKDFFQEPFIAFGVWVILCALFYHLLAGIRHLIMDFGFGEKINTAKASAVVLFALFLGVATTLGYYLW